MNKSELSDKIKKLALEAGFDACGISKVEILHKDKSHLVEFLNNNFHGNMGYMARNIDMRTNPAEILEDAKSVISVLMNYYPEVNLHSESKYKISKYALGKDYHFVIKERLKSVMDLIKLENPEVKMRAFTDSAPVLDKVWAQKAGLGWTGKHSLLINKKLGSFFFIGEIILDMDLVADSPFENEYCGSCTKCIDACPTNAITEAYKLDATKCISYLTIESKDDIPEDLHEKLNDWIFGCDICQDVCPWNSKLSATKEASFKISDTLCIMKKEDWENLEKPKFDELFKYSSIKRSGFDKLKSVINTINSI